MNTRAKSKPECKTTEKVLSKTTSKNTMTTPKREPQPTDEVNIFKRKVLKESASTSGSATSHKGVLPRNYEHSPYEDETEENHSRSKTYTDLNNVAFNEMAPRYDEDDEFLNNYSSSSSNIAGSAFSVTRSLNEQTTAPIPISSHLSNAMKEGNMLKLGKLLRGALQENTVSEVQLRELARSMERPNIPIMSMLIANEKSDLEDLKSFNAASLFLLTLPPSHEKPLKRLECSVNSLSHSLKDTNQSEVLEHRELDKVHRISSIEVFVDLDLNRFYANHVLVGESVIYQLTNMIVQLFRKITEPSFNIWKYSFHPKSSKAVDSNFLPLPPSVVTSLQEFCFDICEAYLPDDLLAGDIDRSSSFMEKLPMDSPENEILRRRSIRQTVLKMANNSIWQAFRTIRSYHFNRDLGILLSCSGRGDCSSHLRWDHLKAYRESLRTLNLPSDDYSTEDVVQFSATTPVTPRRDNRKRLHATSSL